MADRAAAAARKAGIAPAADGTVSKSELAKILGRSNGAVSHWITGGKLTQRSIVMVEGRRPRVHLARAMQELDGSLDATQGTLDAHAHNSLPQSTPAAVDQSLQDRRNRAKAEREELALEKDRLDLARQRGDLLPKAEVAAGLIGTLSLIKAELERAPQSLAAMLEADAGVPPSDAQRFARYALRDVRKTLTDVLRDTDLSGDVVAAE